MNLSSNHSLPAKNNIQNKTILQTERNTIEGEGFDP